MEYVDDLVEEVPPPAGNLKASDGGSGAPGATSVSASAQARKERFPRARRQHGVAKGASLASS